MFTSCHVLQFALLLRSVFILFGHLVYFRLSLLFRFSDQNSVHISHLCSAPPIGLQSKRLNCSLCSSADTPATSLKFSAPSAQRPSGHKCNSLMECDTVQCGREYDGISRYCGNFSTYVPDYSASHLRRWPISGHLYQNFRRIYYREYLWFESYIKFL